MGTTFQPSPSDVDGFDPGAYAVEAPESDASARSAGAAGAGHAEGGETRSAGPSPVNHELVAMVCSRLAAAGITDPDRLAKFQQSYSADLVRLFDTLELGEALAHYGIGIGDGAELPPWARLAGSVGGVAVLAMMHRPELLAPLLAAVRERMGGRRDPDEGRSADGFEPDDDAEGAADPGDAGDGWGSAGGDRAAA